jgi:Mg-chelatase subunit ChlD
VPVDEGREPDPAVHALTREILARLAIGRPRRDMLVAPGSGELVSRPFRGVADEIDMDRTVDVLAERRPLLPWDVVVRERRRRPRAVVLAVDISGSMRGERVKLAAATVGALAAELEHSELAVITFWSDAAWLTRFGETCPPTRLVERMLAIPTRGLTNVGFPLEVAAEELRRVRGRDARVVLLSDCVHNAGPDPRAAAARLPRLDILLDVSGESDLELARDLGRIGRGRTRRARSDRDVAAALNDVFAP